MIEAAEQLTAREKEIYDATGIIVWNYKQYFYLVRERDHALLAGPFESREKALDCVPEIQAQEPPLAEARRFDLVDFWAGAKGWYIGNAKNLRKPFDADRRCRALVRSPRGSRLWMRFQLPFSSRSRSREGFGKKESRSVWNEQTYLLVIAVAPWKMSSSRKSGRWPKPS